MKTVQVFLLASVLLQLSMMITGVISAVKRTDTASWGSLRHKLNQILDSESKEVGILQNLLMESENSLSHPDESQSQNGQNIKENSIDTFSKDKGDKSDAPLSPETRNLREQGIITKLEDNSKRMDTMMVFLTDLRNVLSEAITTQSKQMNFEGEVVELREEIEYLRKEMQALKKEQALNSLNRGSSLENKLQNDETTINWLKDSAKELRNQINDMSRSCNASALLQMEQKLEQQTQRQQSDLLVVQKEIEAIQVQQLKQGEQILEANGNIADVRSWQTNMGQKFIESQTTLSEDLHQSNEVTENEISAEEHFLTEALKEASKATSPTRHGRKLRDKLREINRAVKQLAQDHYRFHKRLVKVEGSQRQLKRTVTNIKQLMVPETTDSTAHEENSSTKLDSRLSGVEHTISEYTLSLQNLGEKVNVLNELQESTSQLFGALEGLETRYDEKLTDMQTSLAKIEASVSAVSNSNEDIKEQQTDQTGQLQSVKKDLLATKGKLQTNHLRLASLQSQILKWSAQRCSVENSESIQNIRISSIESMLQSKSSKVF